MTFFDGRIVEICVIALAVAVLLALYKVWLRLLGIVTIPGQSASAVA